MRKINDLFQELGISKVRLAKYLGVSRQMVYNYLDLNDLNKLPKEKKLLILRLLDIDEPEELDKIEITTDYLMAVESRLNQGVKNTNDLDTQLDLKGLSKDSQVLVNDIVYILKDKLLNDGPKQENYNAMLYLYHLLQSMDNVPEIKYIFAYMSKTTGFTSPEEYKFNEEQQFIFEGIIYTALTLYNNGGASKSKLIEYHRKFVEEIQEKREEKLTRTEQLNTLSIQALQELGYSSITAENAAEVYEKMAEIESRRV